MYVIAIYIYMVKKLLIHKSHITLPRFRLHGVIFIKVKSDHIFKAQPLIFMHLNKICINLNGSCPGGQAQNGHFPTGLFLFDNICYLFSYLCGGFMLI